MTKIAKAVNKTAEVRKLYAQGVTTPAAVQERLAKRGIKIASSQLYTTLSQLREDSKKSPGNGHVEPISGPIIRRSPPLKPALKKRIIRRRRKIAKASDQSSADVDRVLKQFVLARQFVAQVGSLKRARMLLDRLNLFKE